MDCRSRSGEDRAYFLTTLGVETVLRVSGIPKLETDPATGELRYTAQTAYQLSMAPAAVPHQLGLNSFVLALHRKVGDRIPYRYLDRRYMPPCSASMMPDGLIEFQDTLILLEEDRGNERGEQLTRKFLRYRDFLSAPQPFYRGRKIVLLFLLDSVRGIRRRKNSLWSCMRRCLADQDGFEAFADSPEVLLDILACRILGLENRTGWSRRDEEDMVKALLHRSAGFSFAHPDLRNRIPVTYHAYMRHLTPQRTIQVIRGRRQEFLMDFWLNGELSVLHKILCHRQLSGALRRWERVGRDIPYLVVVPDPGWLWNVARHTALLSSDLHDVFFTTPTRIQKKPFPEALFQLDALGNLFHFQDASLQEQVFETRLRNG